MFRLNEEYVTKGGHKAVVVKTDAEAMYGTHKCPILAIITIPGNMPTHSAYFFGEDGRYLGTGNAAYDLVSNEPTSEEKELISQIGDICERVENREETILKVIRQLRKK